jgi:hypothetical protein
MALTQPVFRSIEFSTDMSLTLDQPIPANVQPYMQQVGSKWMVNPSIIQNAKTIAVTLSGNNVQLMEFTYMQGTSYQDLVTRYTEGLGTPTSSAGQQSVWNDGTTVFTLTAQGQGSGSLVSSTLRDA